MGYTVDVLKGISWIGGIRVITRVVSIVRTAIIARILSPSQVGLFGIAALMLSLLEIFTETGINIFLIQQKNKTDSYINTAWVVSIARGIIIALVILFFAPLISAFFNASDSRALLMMIATVPLVRGFINPSVAKFFKDLHFSKEFYYRTSIFFVESLITVVFVFVLNSPAGLVFGLIVGAVYEVILSFIIVTPIPRFIFNREQFLTVIHHGKWLTLAGVFNYLYHNGDNIVVGKLLGVTSLGLYDIAYRISTLPISEISDTIVKVTFPVYVKISEDKKRLRRALIKATALITIFVIPIGLILFIFPEYIIRTLLGDQWISAAPALQILAVFGIVRAIFFSPVAIFYGLSRQDIITLITFVSLVGMAATIIPFVKLWDLQGAAYAALVGTILAIPVTLYYLRKVLYE